MYQQIPHCRRERPKFVRMLKTTKLGIKEKERIMRKIRKAIALLATLVMVMGLSLTAFAAETTNVTVTVDNVENAELYVAQIVVPDTSSTDGWKYVDEYKSFFSELSIQDLILIAKGTENGNAATGKLTTSSELAAALENLRTTVQNEKNKITGNSFEATVGGLYVVVPVKSGYTYSPTLVYVPVNSDNPIEVQTKGAKDQIVKNIDNSGESVSAGDIVQYTVTVEYPYISANYNQASFKVRDTLTNATFVIDERHPVEITGLDERQYIVSDSNEKSSLEIKFSPYDSTRAGTTITIKYWVEVGANVSSTNPLKNKVSSELQLDPDGPTTKTEYVVISTPVQAVINKVDETLKKLPGAVFALYKGNAADENADTVISIIADAESTQGITLPDEYKGYQSLLIADGDADGNITFDGLDAQEQYYVVEIIAPDGYQIDGINHQLISGGVMTGYPSNKTETIGNVTTITTEYKYNNFKVNKTNNNITNTKLAELPGTGGIGTTIFTIGGCVIMIAAAGLYFASRRKHGEN